MIVRIGSLLLALLTLSATASQKYPLTTPLSGPQSLYTRKVLDLLLKWPETKKHLIQPEKPNGLAIRCLKTPENDLYIGLEQVMHVSASLERVEAVLDDVNNYARLFFGFKDVRIVSRDDNRWTISWEQEVPFFFVPNVKYDTFYLVDSSQPGRKFYRYKLKESGQLKFSDGAIIVETESNGGTLFAEFDYFEADWGILKVLGVKKIWRESIESIVLSDFAIKLKAEHPDWDYERVKDASKKAVSTDLSTHCDG